MRDGATGRSRGFGFLTFKDPKTVNTVMVKEHFLDGKIVRPAPFARVWDTQKDLGTLSHTQHNSNHYLQHYAPRYPMKAKRLPYFQIDPKRAIPKDEQEKTAKIFVGGVSQDATEADFTDFFAQFGRVIDATLMMDKDTGRPRGFGFVTFDNDLAVERCLEFRPLEILNKPIEVKRAQPRGKMGEEEDFRGGRGRGKFGRDDRFSDNQNQAQGQGPAVQGMNGMSPQMMAQYWQRMQQYFQVMQQQMMANAMGGMGQMNPQMMAQMQQMQRMQGANSPGGMGNMNPQQMQQMQQQMMMQMQAGGGINGMGAQQGQGGQSGGAGRGSFTPQQQNSFEQQKYEQLARKGGGAPSGPRSGSRSGSQGPQSWEGMYDDVPQPDGSQGGRGSANTPKAAPAQPSNAPANAPTGPKNPGKPPGGGGGFRGGGGGGFRGGRGGGGRYHPYGR